jgi:hypothetical protein
MKFEFNAFLWTRAVPMLAACLLLSQCKSGPPPAPGDKAFHGGDAKAYRDGYHHGYSDGMEKLEPSFERYYPEYSAETKEVFHGGYRAGYDAGRHGAPATSGDEDRASQNGYDAGQSDAQNGLRPDPSRYRSQYSAGSEAAFREGYARGYRDARRE